MHRFSFKYLFSSISALILAGCIIVIDDPSSRAPESRSKTSQQAVAMPDAFSADVAMSILNRGGNAVDAAIAAQFVLAVTFPEAGNIGGGGFMLIHKDNKQYFLDYREMAPGAAHRDMYLDEDGNVIQFKSLFGVLSAGIPGTVDGMWRAHQTHGSIPWDQLVQPAVDLAIDGFIVPEKLGEKISQHIERLAARNIDVNFAAHFNGAKSGALFKQTDLGNTLKRIRDNGPDGFYAGETAKIISDFMREKGGLINEEDLQKYKSEWRQPITAKWRNYTLVTAPPPSSGGIAVLQWLTMYDMVKERLKLNPEHNSAEYMHVLAEVGKRVFADRAEYLGDPDFVTVPLDQLLEQEYLLRRSADIRTDAISVTDDIEPGLPESEDTTHFSIVDKMGNAVSNTTTINISFGSGEVVEGAGFLLNDEMDDFSAKEGVPNVFGALGAEANSIAPYKRMLSSMTPSIVMQDGQVKLVTGSPGGTTIITSVYQSILNALEFDMPAKDVVNMPRFHHQLFPENQIRHHPGITPDVLTKLETFGYDIRERNFGDLHVILRKGDRLSAASESRGRGKAVVQVTRD
jgi:gamma-glutamyltranspeptidase/glutathione hydrolase